MRVFGPVVASMILTVSQALYAPIATAEEVGQTVAGGLIPTAQDSMPTSPGDSLTKISEYLANLGKYFGYDLTEYCGPDGKCGEGASPTSTTLINKENTALTQLGAFVDSLGTLLGGSTNPIVADDKSVIQSASGAQKVYPNYANAPGTNQSSPSLSVAPSIDQKAYQEDPVRQAVLNMLTTPDMSYCMSIKDAAACSLLSRQSIITNEWLKPAANGNAANSKLPDVAFPSANDLFSPATSTNLLGQLNSDSFLMPLLYSKTDIGGGGQGNSQPKGLTAKTQAEQAANFVRYVTGLVNPLPVATFKDYYLQYSNAMATSVDKDEELAKVNAQTILGDYLMRLRIYTAQSSVAISNIYQMMARRMPQSEGKDASSAALSEFKMATWRLADSSKTPDEMQAWLEKIQQASSVTVQKEIAVLLAEINYQMYLTRQQNERMLLTQSIGLLQMARFAAPSPRLNQPQITP